MHYYLKGLILKKVATCHNCRFLQMILTTKSLGAVYCGVIAFVLSRVGTGKVKQVNLNPLWLRIHSICRKKKNTHVAPLILVELEINFRRWVQQFIPPWSLLHSSFSPCRHSIRQVSSAQSQTWGCGYTV